MILATDRLLLREFVEQDWPDVFLPAVPTHASGPTSRAVYRRRPVTGNGEVPLLLTRVVAVIILQIDFRQG
jgi:hypothetical protein